MGAALARRLRRDGTGAERLLWSALRARGLAGAKVRRQHPLGGFVLDFYCAEARLAVEVDGGQHCDSAADAARDAALRAAGLTVIRYWNHEVMGNLDGVLEDLAGRIVAGRAAVAAARGLRRGDGVEAPSPQPSPPVGGEGARRRGLVAQAGRGDGEEAATLRDGRVAGAEGGDGLTAPSPRPSPPGGGRGGAAAPGAHDATAGGFTPPSHHAPPLPHGGEGRGEGVAAATGAPGPAKGPDHAPAAAAAGAASTVSTPSSPPAPPLPRGGEGRGEGAAPAPGGPVAGARGRAA
jgi:very-short-patch-repair endonuclease